MRSFAYLSMCVVTIVTAFYAAHYEAGDVAVSEKEARQIQAEREAEVLRKIEVAPNDVNIDPDVEKRVKEIIKGKSTLRRPYSSVVIQPVMSRGGTVLELSLRACRFDMDGHTFIATSAGGLLHSPGCACQKH